jgi:hypothetical protein
MFVSSALALSLAVVGLLVSYWVDAPPGATIAACGNRLPATSRQSASVTPAWTARARSDHFAIAAIAMTRCGLRTPRTGRPSTWQPRRAGC